MSIFRKYISTKIFYKRFIIAFVIMANVLLWVTNFKYFYELLKIGGNLSDAVLTVYDIGSTYSLQSFIIMLITLAFSSINISLMLEYVKLQRDMNSKTKRRNSSMTAGAIGLAMLASHCASCGAVIFGGIISVSYLALLPFGGLELGIIGIIILVYANHYMIKKLNNPYTC